VKQVHDRVHGHLSERGTTYFKSDYSLDRVLMKSNGLPNKVLITRYFVKRVLSYYVSVMRGLNHLFFVGNILMKTFLFNRT
jgi:hypothetical protein